MSEGSFRRVENNYFDGESQAASMMSGMTSGTDFKRVPSNSELLSQGTVMMKTSQLNSEI